MTRFVWTAWGLLVVVLDLPLAGWDVLPDIVGYAWVVIGLAGATAAPFTTARSAALAGIVVAVITGTPLLYVNIGVSVVALILDTLVLAVVIHQLCEGLLQSAAAEDEETRRWAERLRIGAYVLLGVGILAVVGALVGVGLLVLLGRLVTAVIGILTIVLLQRVARSGVLAPD